MNMDVYDAIQPEDIRHEAAMYAPAVTLGSLYARTQFTFDTLQVTEVMKLQSL
jgi:hypothetical protein